MSSQLAGQPSGMTPLFVALPHAGSNADYSDIGRRSYYGHRIRTDGGFGGPMSGNFSPEAGERVRQDGQYFPGCAYSVATSGGGLCLTSTCP